MFEDVPQLNLSATALSIEGGVVFPIAITQGRAGDVGLQCDEACGRRLCLDFAAMAKIHPVTKRSSLQIAIVPSSGSWRILRPAQYGDVIPTDFELSPGVANLKQIVFVEGTFFQKWTCVSIINLKSPVLPFPMLGSLKFSYNDGQKFVGPAATILFYRTLLPQGLAPARGSVSARPRPQVTSFFKKEVLSGASPPITSLQARSAFKKAVGCDPSLRYTCAMETPVCRNTATDPPGCCKQEKVMICPTGPRCTFGSLVSNITLSELGIFDFGDELTLTCNAPEMPAGSANIYVSLDGLTFVPNPAEFLFYE